MKQELQTVVIAMQLSKTVKFWLKTRLLKARKELMEGLKQSSLARLYFFNALVAAISNRTPSR